MESLQAEREAVFLQGVGAFMRRDFGALERSMRADIQMTLPGSSWLAGTYRGPRAVASCILGLRKVLDSSEDRISFLHAGDRMMVRHEITLHGPQHETEMVFFVGVSFDPDGRVRSVSVEPEDLGLLDHVLNSVDEGSDAS